MNPIKSLKNLKPVKLSIYILLSIALLFTLTCDIYDKSVPDYLDKYTNTATVADHSITGGMPINLQGLPYPNLILPDSSVITLKLRNPKNYEILTHLDYFDGGSWIPFTRYEVSGDYSTVENTSAAFPGTTITLKYDPTTQIRMIINNTEIGQEYKLRVRLQDRETKREFEPYVVSSIKCTDYPKAVGFIMVRAGTGNKGVVVDWQQVLRSGSTTGDHADANRLVISCSDLGVSQTYTRELNPVTSIWGPWSPGGINETGSPFFSIELGAGTSLVEGRSYNVVLRYSNEAGVVTEISEALTAATMDARIVRGSPPDEYASLQEAFDSMNTHGETSATITVLRSIIDQAPITISGNKTITLESSGSNLIQLGSAGNSLLSVHSGLNLKIGGASSGALTLKGLDTNTVPVIIVQTGGTLTLDANAIITGNKNISSNGGGISSNGTFTMNGGSVEGNSAPSGGGVYIAAGTVTLTGGTIQNNTATTTGGGIHVATGIGALNMDNSSVEIKNNTASTNGGGIYFAGTNLNMNPSSAVISNNTATNNGGGIHVASGSLNMGGGTIDNNTANNGAGIYMVGTGSLTMNSNNVKITGNRAIAGDGGGVLKTGTGTFTMSAGTIGGPTLQTRNSASGNGGGVVIDGGMFNISNTAIIEGNNAGGNGGGVYSAAGTLNMTTGAPEIRSNTASGNGGGLYIAAGSFTMSVGTVKGNTATFGGGIHSAGGTFTLSGGSIEGNTASTNGGGVNVDGGSMTMSNGFIYGTDATPSSLANRATTGSGDSLNVVSGTAVYSGTYGTGNILDGSGLGSYGYTLPPNEATVTIGSTDYHYPTLLDAFESIGNSTTATITLRKNVTDFTYDITGTNKAITLISYGPKEIGLGTLAGSVFTVSSGVTFKVGNSTSGQLSLVGRTTPTNTGAVITVDGGTLELNANAIITGNTGGGGVRINSGTFNMIAGSIIGNRGGQGGGVYLGTGTEFNMSGGIIGGSGAAANSGSTGGGVYLNGGQMTMTGGSIEGNSATGALPSNGGGIFVTNGTITMNGASASIKDNTAANHGGGIYLAGGNFTMSNGTIDGNTATGATSSFGGGVYVAGASATFNMSGGTMQNNASTYGNGGGIYLAASGNFNMSNTARITSAANNDIYLASGTMVNIDGALSASPAGQVARITPASYTAQVLDGNIDGGTPANNTRFDVTPNGGLSYLINGDGFLFQSIIEVKILTTSTQAVVSTEYTDDLAYAISKANTVTLGTQETVITMLNNTPMIIARITQDIVRKVTIQSSGAPRTISHMSTPINSNGSLLSIGNGGTLILKGESATNTLTLTGKGLGIPNNGALIYVASAGTLTMEDNTIISENNHLDGINGGGGVRVDGGIFNLNGGAITGNRAAKGGGVNIQSGTFNMNSGTIASNTTDTDGGGVYVDGGTFTMNGGTIAGNSVPAGTGGGVFVNGGNFTLNHGGIIYGSDAAAYSTPGGANTASGGGHSLYIASGVNAKYSDFPWMGEDIIFGTGNRGINVTIPEETAQVGTGTIFPSLSSALTSILNGTATVTVLKDIPAQPTINVSGNKIINLVSSANRTITLSGTGTLITVGTNTTLRIGDSSGETGGAASPGTLTLSGRGMTAGNENDYPLVMVNTFGTLNLYDKAIITNNNNTETVNYTGGGVRTQGGTFNMYGGSITGNRTSSGGGGVTMQGPFNMSGGTIEGNNAVLGGGVFVTAGQTFNMTGGAIAGNSATNGGGVFANVANFTMSGTSSQTAIRGNTATSAGGGVYVAGTSTFTMNGGIIYGSGEAVGLRNTAPGGHASLYADSGSTTIYGSSLGGGPIFATTTNSTIEITDDTLPDQVAQVGSVVYPSLAAAFNSIATTGTVSLLKSITVPATIDITGVSRTITLENNTTPAKTITLGLNGPLFTLSSSTVQLIVRGTGTNTLTLVGRPSNTAAFIRVDSGTFELQSNAIIENNVNTANYGTGGGVFVNGGTLTLSGGTIRGCKVTGATSSWGGGVLVAAGGTFTMNSGTIGGTATGAANEANGGGGGVYVANGTFNMNTPGGNITNNTANSNGAGVVIDASGTFTMNAGTIQGNVATSAGGGVYVDGGQMSMAGGTIGGSNGNKSYNGAGVYMVSGVFNMSAGNIDGNTATNSGGGVYMTGGTFTMSGGNIYGTGDTGANIASTNSASLYIGAGNAEYTSTLTAVAGVNDQIIIGAGPRSVSFTLPDRVAQVGSNIYPSLEAAFRSITTTGTVSVLKDIPVQATITLAGSRTITLRNNATPIKTITLGSNGPLFTLDGSVQLIVSGAAPLYLSGRTSNDAAFVRVNSGTSFELASGARIENNVNTVTNGGGVHVNGGTLTLSGGTIRTCQAITGTGLGGGVYVSNGGTFNMNSGTIGGTTAADANIASAGGGGVYIEGTNATNLSNFTMSYGTISYNKANNSYGAGVHVGSFGTFTMSSGTIEGNEASGTTTRGGGVYVATNGQMKTEGYPANGNIVGNKAYQGAGIYFNSSGQTLTINGGIIQDNDTSSNSATGSGGGIYVAAGNLTITGNTAYTDIKGNKSYDGAGVYVATGSSFTFNTGLVGGLYTSGTISGNTATNNGGGVYFSGTTFNMSNAPVISGNTATESGGGVYLGGGTFTMTGGKIGETVAGKENKASYGAGVYVAGGTFTLGPGTPYAEVAGNEATASGGGVYVAGAGSFAINSGGLIYNNTAFTSGGGVYKIGTGTFTMSSGQIDNNSTSQTTGRTGGGVHIASGSFTMSGGSMQRNKAYDGGGVYFTGGGTFNMTGGGIGGLLSYVNTASNNGGGVYMNNGTFDMSAGSIEGNTATRFGGGLYKAGTGTATLRGTGTISNNSAGGTGASATNLMGGGGVYSTAGFTMSGGTISNNTTTTNAYNNGGGVYIVGGNFSFSGGTIHTNTAYDGGGVYLRDSTMTMSGTATGTVIRSNTGSSGGGGVFVSESATFTMQGGTIGGVTGATPTNANKTSGSGAGVHVNPGTFNMSGGVIEGNEAWHGGGVLVGGTFNMSGSAVIRNNLATTGSGTAGGGVRLAWGNATMTMTGSAAIRGNTAESGGGVSVAVGTPGSKFEMSSGIIEGNNALIGGGGVHVENNGEFIMSGGNVRGTTAPANTAPTGASIQVLGSPGARYSGGYGTGTIVTTNNDLP